MQARKGFSLAIPIVSLHAVVQETDIMHDAGPLDRRCPQQSSGGSKKGTRSIALASSLIVVHHHRERSQARRRPAEDTHMLLACSRAHLVPISMMSHLLLTSQNRLIRRRPALVRRHVRPMYNATGSNCILTMWHHYIAEVMLANVRGCVVVVHATCRRGHHRPQEAGAGEPTAVQGFIGNGQDQRGQALPRIADAYISCSGHLVQCRHTTAGHSRPAGTTSRWEPWAITRWGCAGRRSCQPWQHGGSSCCRPWRRVLTGEPGARHGTLPLCACHRQWQQPRGRGPPRPTCQAAGRGSEPVQAPALIHHDAAHARRSGHASRARWRAGRGAEPHLTPAACCIGIRPRLA